MRLSVRSDTTNDIHTNTPWK